MGAGAVRSWGSVGIRLSSDGGRSIFWGARYKTLWGCLEDEAGIEQSRGPRGAAKPPSLVAYQHVKMEGWWRDGGVLVPQMALGSVLRLRPCPSYVGIGSRGMAGKKGGMPGIPKSSGSDDGLSKFDLSNVIANMATGERLTTQEYKKMSTWTVLRVFEDGTKEEMTLSECVEDAEEEGLKVVMVAKAAKPPVVKVMDFGKVMKDKQKKAKEVAKKATAQSIKELRVSLNIGQHDLDVKMRQGAEFLQKGHKVKLFSKLRGADFFHRQEQALKHLRDIAAQVGAPQILFPSFTPSQGPARALLMLSSFSSPCSSTDGPSNFRWYYRFRYRNMA